MGGSDNQPFATPSGDGYFGDAVGNNSGGDSSWVMLTGISAIAYRLADYYGDGQLTIILFSTLPTTGGDESFQGHHLGPQRRAPGLGHGHGKEQPDV